VRHRPGQVLISALLLPADPSLPQASQGERSMTLASFVPVDVRCVAVLDRKRCKRRPVPKDGEGRPQVGADMARVS